ncbi:MAG: hypothetical protein ABEN55_07970 [Bradymonadaceae bacterium]
MDDIEDYQPRETEVVATDRGRLEIFFDEPLPDRGNVVALDSPDGETVYAVVRRHLGGNRVRAAMPEVPDWLQVGTSATAPGGRAGLTIEGGRLELDPGALVPETDDGDWFPIDWRKPDFADITAATAPVDTGYDGIDTVAPPVAGGLNLLIDQSNDASAFQRLAERVVDGVSSAEAIYVADASGKTTPDWADTVVEPGAGAFGRIFAIRTAVALTSHRRDAGRETLIVGHLPAVGRTVADDEEVGASPGYGELVDRIGAGLVSTDDARVTSLFRLPVPRRHSDIGPIIETLDVGDVDAQLLIDTDGRFDPERSSSDAPLDDDRRARQTDARDTLRRAERARDKAQLLGKQELLPDEEAAIERADTLRDQV